MTVPEAGSRWVHRANKRECVVTDVRYVKMSTGLEYFVEFHYKRGGDGMAGSLGFRRSKHPTQTMPLDQWRSFFTTEIRPAS